MAIGYILHLRSLGSIPLGGTGFDALLTDDLQNVLASGTGFDVLLADDLENVLASDSSLYHAITYTNLPIVSPPNVFHYVYF